MMPQDERHVELLDLLSELCNGTVSVDEQDRLTDLLRTGDDAVLLYLEYMQVHAELRCREQAALPSGTTADAHASASSFKKNNALPEIEVKPANFSRRNKRYDSIHWQRHRIRFNAMTAVLTALAWVGFSYFLWSSTSPDGSRPNRTGTIQYVAEITGQHEHQWAEGMPPMSVRHALLSGEQLNLAEGLVEITFDDGAVVVLEGPTDFVVDSSGAGTLSRGSLAAEAHERFTINTPRATFIDLGTWFGIRVDEDGAVEAHVFEGEIEARLAGGPGRHHATVLRAGDGVTLAVGRTRFDRISSDRELFAIAVPRVEAPQRAGQYLLVESECEAAELRGDIRYLAEPPPSVALGACTDNERASMFLERSNVTLADDVTVTIDWPGTYDRNNPGGTQVVPAGTRVDSYLLHFDAVDDLMHLAKGSVTFERPIIGVIATEEHLRATDALLGAPQTAFEGGGNAKRARLNLDGQNSEDRLRWSQDRLTLEFQFDLGSSGGDQVRVLVAAGDDEVNESTGNDAVLKEPQVRSAYGA